MDEETKELLRAFLEMLREKYKLDTTSVENSWNTNLLSKTLTPDDLLEVNDFINKLGADIPRKFIEKIAKTDLDLRGQNKWKDKILEHNNFIPKFMITPSLKKQIDDYKQKKTIEQQQQTITEQNEEISRLKVQVGEVVEYYKKASAEEKEAILKDTEKEIANAKDEATRKIFEDAKNAMLLLRDTYEKKLDETKKLIPPRVLSNQEKQALLKSFGPVIDKAAREHIPDDNLPYYFKERGIENPELQKSLAQVVRQREAGMLTNRMINERILNRPELLDTLTAPMRDQYFENVPQFRQPRPQDLPLPIQNENWAERAPIPKRWLTRRMYWQVKNM